MKKRSLKYFLALLLCLAVVTTAGISSAAERERSPATLLNGTMLAANALSANLTDAYTDYVINPLGSMLFNLLYSEDESLDEIYTPYEPAPNFPEPPLPAPPIEQSQEPAPVVQVAAPLSDLNLIELVKKIISDEISYSSSGGGTGPAGLRVLAEQVRILLHSFPKTLLIDKWTRYCHQSRTALRISRIRSGTG